MSIHLTIKNENRPYLRTAMPKKNLSLVVVVLGKRFVLCWEWKEQLMQHVNPHFETPSNVGDETGHLTSDGEKSWQSTQSNSDSTFLKSV